MEPLVRPGQSVVVDRRLPVRSGDVAVVDLARDADAPPEWVLKKVEIVAGLWRLVSVNPAGETFELPGRPREALAVTTVMLREMGGPDWVADDGVRLRPGAAERTYRETPEELREREDREAEDKTERYGGGVSE
jgi:hypothetical protein